MVESVGKRPVEGHIWRMQRSYFLVLILALAACEQATTDPSIRAEYAAALAGKPNTLPALLGEALLVAQRQQGNEAVAALLTDWEKRQAEVRATHTAGDRSAVQLKLQALHAEEIRIVLKVFGPDIVPRVIQESQRNLANTSARLHESARDGAAHVQAQVSTEEIQEMLERANSLGTQDPERALALVTQATEQLAAIDELLTNLRSVRSIETLFPEAAQKLSPAALARHTQLQRAAALALGKDTRAEASLKLEAVRAEEVRIVLATFGNEIAAQILDEADAAIRDTRLKLNLMKDNGRDVLRLQRMLKSATDFYNHARTAEQVADYATALDHGSHAAGLLNSLQDLMTR